MPDAPVPPSSSSCGVCRIVTTDPVSISKSLDRVFRSLRGPDRSAVRGVFGEWAQIVGEQVAAHVQPVQLDGSALLVQVDEPGWATEMKFLSPIIIERLARAKIVVDRIDVRVEPRNNRGQRSR